MAIGASEGFRLDVTDIIDQTAYDDLNNGIRKLELSQGDIDDLAAFLGVGGDTALRWFQIDEDDYQVCIPDKVIDRRAMHLYPLAGWPKRGIGDAPEDELKERENARYRVWFCAMAGRTELTNSLCGLTSVPPFTGTLKVTELYPGTISNCLKIWRKLYDYESDYFLAQAWARVVMYLPTELEALDGKPLTWRLRIWYKKLKPEDESQAPRNVPNDDQPEEWELE